MIQASGLDGPIHSGISLLENLSDLLVNSYNLIALPFYIRKYLIYVYSLTNKNKCRRFSDLSGSETAFPPFSNMKNLKTLILRSCNIMGQIPDYLGTMTNLKTLLFITPRIKVIQVPVDSCICCLHQFFFYLSDLINLNADISLALGDANIDLIASIIIL
ncbi:uncharacterized protein LOC132267314 [Cornus florida]|uniref:uncharacterized protein LOC132267314 n=1 Tax=Cornus florida TaxID=4283 RepID=UPI00289B59D7|nr:uncharacterized protein LOC132267314 [Cornus florida]